MHSRCEVLLRSTTDIVRIARLTGDTLAHNLSAFLQIILLWSSQLPPSKTERGDLCGVSQGQRVEVVPPRRGYLSRHTSIDRAALLWRQDLI